MITSITNLKLEELWEIDKNTDTQIRKYTNTLQYNLKLEELWEIDGDAEHEEKGATDRKVWTDLKIFLFYLYQTFVFCLCKILICCPICCF